VLKCLLGFHRVTNYDWVRMEYGDLIGTPIQKSAT